MRPAACPPGARRPRSWLDAYDPDPLRSGTSRFFCEAAQVLRVAGEQDDRPGLTKRDHGEQRIQGTPVTRHPRPAQQLASRAALLLVDRDHGDPAEHVVHASVPGTAAQDFGKGRRGGNDVAAPSPDDLEEVPRPRIATGQLDETLGIENQ
jgi:hypothetical protein